MRMPLGTGIPLLLTGSSTQDTIFDLTSAIPDVQSRVNLVTLYAFAPGGGTPGGNDVTFYLNGTAFTAFDIEDDLYNYQASNRALRKVLDRFPMRGEVELTAASAATQVNQKVYLVGFVELEGSYDPPQPVRPLQADDLVSPYTYEPASIVNGEPASIEIQAIETGFIDEITLWVHGSGAASPQLVISNGTDSISIDCADVGAPQPILFLDGIPIQGLESGAGITIEGPEATDSIIAYGSFTRR